MPVRRMSVDGGILHAEAAIQPPGAPAWAVHLSQQLSQIQNAVQKATLSAEGVRPVLRLTEALRYTGCQSVSAYYRWMATWAPRAACGHGRYALSALRVGIEKEAMQSRRQRHRFGRTTAPSDRNRCLFPLAACPLNESTRKPK
jgi:hypothetical protein